MENINQIKIKRFLMFLETNDILLFNYKDKEIDEEIKKILIYNPIFCYINFEIISKYTCKISFGISDKILNTSIIIRLKNKYKILYFRPVRLLSNVEVRWLRYLSSPYSVTIVQKSEVKTDIDLYYIFESNKILGRSILNEKFINSEIKIFDDD